jgi:hypothetical protein
VSSGLLLGEFAVQGRPDGVGGAQRGGGSLADLLGGVGGVAGEGVGVGFGVPGQQLKQGRSAAWVLGIAATSAAVMIRSRRVLRLTDPPPRPLWVVSCAMSCSPTSRETCSQNSASWTPAPMSLMVAADQSLCIPDWLQTATPCW